jgi:hypothetical protein
MVIARYSTSHLKQAYIVKQAMALLACAHFSRWNGWKDWSVTEEGGAGAADTAIWARYPNAMGFFDANFPPPIWRYRRDHRDRLKNARKSTFF